MRPPARSVKRRGSGFRCTLKDKKKPIMLIPTNTRSSGANQGATSATTVPKPAVRRIGAKRHNGHKTPIIIARSAGKPIS